MAHLCSSDKNSGCYGNLRVSIYGIYCYLTADILTKVLQKCSLSSPLPNVSVLSRSVNVIGSHGN